MNDDMPLKVEVVRPSLEGEAASLAVTSWIISVLLEALLVWWFFASWFPQLGYTWWQLILPVVIVEFLFNHPVGRYMRRAKVRSLDD